jgi:hypothetical protein
MAGRFDSGRIVAVLGAVADVAIVCFLAKAGILRSS